MFATTGDLENAVLDITVRVIPENEILTEEFLQSAVGAILNSQFQLESPQGRQFLQTVRIVKDRNTWVPVTIHFQTNETGAIDYVRIHAPRFVVEGRR